jgi:hypothetical protein
MDLEKRFFDEQQAGNGTLSFHCLFEITTDDTTTVPLIAIFTKFDDLITQIYDPELGEDENHKAAANVLEGLQAPLFKLGFPPRAYVCLEGMFEVFFYWSVNLLIYLIYRLA